MGMNLIVLGFSIILMYGELKLVVRAQMAPALFVFGDSLVDVGNNNHLLLSIAKADFPHNGIDFPTHKSTGRFSNGKNAADLIAEKLGLPSSQAYLSQQHNKSSDFLTGISFASGGAGIFDGTDQIFGQSITMNKQVEYFGRVQGRMMVDLGSAGTEIILSKAIFAIVIGSNDILGYFGSSLSDQQRMGTPQQYIASMLLAITSQIKTIYDVGGRKFGMIGIGAVGCCPSMRKKNSTESCNEDANFWASKYNEGLLSVLEDYKTQHTDFQYSFFDTYNVLLNLIQEPATYGFKEVKSACCGLGNLKADVPCIPISTYCSNRSDHVFWDLYHPTEAATRIVAETAFDGPLKYAFPMNLRQLASVV